MDCQNVDGQRTSKNNDINCMLTKIYVCDFGRQFCVQYNNALAIPKKIIHFNIIPYVNESSVDIEL